METLLFDIGRDVACRDHEASVSLDDGEFIKGFLHPVTYSMHSTIPQILRYHMLLILA